MIKLEGCYLKSNTRDGALEAMCKSYTKTKTTAKRFFHGIFFFVSSLRRTKILPF